MKARLIRWLLGQPVVRTWLHYTARPKSVEFEVQWTKDNARELGAFLGTATGRKLTLIFENAKADADAAAVLLSTSHNVMEQIGIARGVRGVLTRLKQLTAVRQNPDNTEADAVSLPPDLEHLRET